MTLSKQEPRAAIRKVSHRETRKLLLAALDHGARVDIRNNRAMVYPEHNPDTIVCVHLTSSDKRALKNARADLRRAGAIS